MSTDSIDIDETRQRLLLIPARGGSKGIPRKNIRIFGGIPLIGHTIRAALEAGIGRVVVTTDDRKIAEVAQDYGAEVPFLRPAHLATDTASGLDVALHAIETLYQNTQDLDLCVLQPTSPLRTATDITAAAKLFYDTQDSVIGVTAATKPLSWHLRLHRDGLLETTASELASRRQDAPTVVIPNGAIYWIQKSELKKHKTLFPPRTRGFLMPAERSVDIDNIIDWFLAEAIHTGKLEAVRARLSAPEQQHE